MAFLQSQVGSRIDELNGFSNQIVSVELLGIFKRIFGNGDGRWK